MKKVKLSDIADEMTMQGDGMEMLLNLHTGKTFFLTSDTRYYVENDKDLSMLANWQKDEIEKVRAIFKTGKYISLPSKYDINEWKIMEDFCETIKGQAQRSRLEEAIRGKGAFHRFRSNVEKMGLLQDWYDYKAAALVEMARIWCEKHNIPYEEVDVKTKKQHKHNVVKYGESLTLNDGQKVYLLKNAMKEKEIWADFRRKLYGDTDAAILEAELDELIATQRVYAFLVWTADEQAIAFLELSQRNMVDGCTTSPVAYLEGIYIVEAFRAKGLGKALIDFCKKWAKTNGMTELATDSSLHDVTAQKFHVRMGFQETERIVQFKMTV